MKGSFYKLFLLRQRLTQYYIGKQLRRLTFHPLKVLLIDFQGKGIAKNLLNAACSHLSEHDISDVYLITTHTEFYEHHGFDFYGNIEEDDGNMIRCYHKKTKSRLF